MADGPPGAKARHRRVSRVLTESDDGADGMWSTVGVDENIIAASRHALEEAVTHGLLRAGRGPD